MYTSYLLQEAPKAVVYAYRRSPSLEGCDAEQWDVNGDNHIIVLLLLLLIIMIIMIILLLVIIQTIIIIIVIIVIIILK